MTTLGLNPLIWLFTGAREGFCFARARERSFSGAREDVNQRAERYLSAHGDAILRLAYSYVHNQADAEDILQDTLIRVLTSDAVLEGPAHERAYLLRTAANLSKNHLKAAKLRETDELNDELVAEEREDLFYVWEAVKRLPEAQREAVHLFYQEGYATAEIASILGRKESTVRSDLRRGREKLRKILKEAYDFE